MKRLEPPLGVFGGLGIFRGVLCRGPRAFGGVDARGGSVAVAILGFLHSTAPTVPMGEPAPAWQGRGTRPEPREMPINILRTSVSPLCHLALPQEGPVPCVHVSMCPAAPLGSWQPCGTREGPGHGGPEVLGGAQKGAGSCAGCVLHVPTAEGAGAAGKWGVGQDTPCQQQPWHWGCLLGWVTAALSCSALQAWQENPGEAFRFHHLSPAGAGEGSAQHQLRARAVGSARSLSQHWQPPEATSQGRGCQGSVVQVLGTGHPVLLLPRGLGGLGCSGGLAAEPQSLSVPSRCPQSSWHCRWVTPVTHLGSTAPRAAVPSWGAPRPHSWGR